MHRRGRKRPNESLRGIADKRKAENEIKFRVKKRLDERKLSKKERKKVSRKTRNNFSGKICLHYTGKYITCYIVVIISG
jgi:hypothetical protein